MIEASAEDLKAAVESQHGGTATLLKAVPVKEMTGDKVVWEGVVHVFGLKDHPKATRAYAWSHAIDGSDKRRFYAVLGVPPVNSAADAVRAAIVADAKSSQAERREPPKYNKSAVDRFLRNLPGRKDRE